MKLLLFMFPLRNNIDKLTNGQTGLRILVPLCGKSVDLKWLADQGHHVVGIEGIPKACKDFFEEAEMNYTETDIPEIASGKLYKSDDGKIQIYCSDIFMLNKSIIGEFDAVMDKASLTAINTEERERYIELLKSVCKPGTRMIVMVVEYDWEKRENKVPPYPFSRKDIDKLYGEWCSLEEIEKLDRTSTTGNFKNVLGVPYLSISYLVHCR
ncbi:putative thiopurine S-methyltransferase isoform X2 [Apostichopus japonicus]|uniref:thiopurine S-methyltransferase n=1 Tax=Stichopus japonicus TaxID=307972 RepID=A0A2G8KS97_STIJA|nr:putative thiopurine S-methyltransferase isoform X2 [Apostichopus japonicus]